MTNDHVKIRVSGIVDESIVDGPGYRLAIFAQGCPHCCKGCHNPQTLPYDGGELITVGEILQMLKDNPLLDGITLTGGEPFEQAGTLAGLAGRVNEMGLNVVTYTGYTYEELLKKEQRQKLLNETWLLIDGRFEQNKRTLDLPFRGSSNQRLVLAGESLRQGKVVEWIPED